MTSMIPRSRRAMTLIELVIAGALFGLFSTMVAHAVVLALRHHNSQTDKITRYRRSSIALNLLAKELQECQCIGCPVFGSWPFSPQSGCQYTFGNDHYTSLQFFRSDIAQGWYLSEWLFDPQAKTVIRKIYTAIAPPQRPAPTGFSLYSPGALDAAHIPAWEPQKGRLMFEGCQSIMIEHLQSPTPRFVRVTAQIEKVTEPLVAEVKVREL
jgi:hypothetical protein